MTAQQCLVLIKPDGLVKSLTGNVITAFSETKLKIVGAKVVKAKKEILEKHYAHLKDKKPQIYEETINYMMGKYHTDRIFALVYQGDNAIEKVREVCGSTNPEDANPVTIRGKYGRINSKTHVFENAIHASDSPESAEREIKLWFSPMELTETIYPTKTENITSQLISWK